MKLPLLSPLGAFLGRHLRTLLIFLIAAILAVGGYYGWGFYQFRQSSQYAFDGLKQALMPPSADELAVRVDFNTLSEELARIVTRVFPFFRSGPDQIHEIKGIIQTSLLKAVLRKNSGQEEKREEDEVDDEKLLMRTMDAVLPPDILTQLATTLTLTPQDENTVLLSAKVHHPILNKDFPLVLRMVRTPDGWIVRNLANAEELARQFRQHLLHRLEARHTILVSKRGTVLERMGSTMSGLSCTASAGLLSDGKTLLVVTHAQARNESDLTVKSIALDIRINNARQKQLLRRFLNAACDIMPGENLDKSWTIELDGQSEEGRALLAAGALTCSPAWRTLSLSSSEVLHVEDLTPTLEPCALAGHEHPHGLCLKPIFSR